MIKKYGKAILSVTMVIALAVLSTSCGTKLPEAGDYTEADSASGSAADADKTDAGSVRKNSMSRYACCNDTNLYTCKDGKIQQCRLDGTVIREYEDNHTRKTWRDFSIEYVTNEEIFCFEYTAAGDGNCTWCIPIDKRADGDCLRLDKAKEILPTGCMSIIYADENCIAYLNYLWRYTEYDRKKDKVLEFEQYTGIRQYIKSYEHVWGKAVGDTVLLAKKGSGKWEDGTQGIYAHKVGTKAEADTLIDDLYVPGDSFMCMSNTEKQAFYSGGWRKNEKGVYDAQTADEDSDIWMYDTEKKEKQRFITGKEIRKYCSKKDNVIEGLFIEGDKLYIWLSESDSDFMEDDSHLVLSRDLSGKTEVKCEKKLSKFLNTLNYYKEHGVVYELDEQSVDFVAGKVIALCFDEADDDRSGRCYKCYDLSDGTSKEVKEGDAEAVYWCYLNGFFM